MPAPLVPPGAPGPGAYPPGHQQPPRPNKWRRPMDIRAVAAVCLILLIALVTVVIMQGGINAKDRTIKVTGEASVTTTPDEFIFSPTYSFTNTDRAAALRDIASKSSIITAGLKNVGVNDSQIKSNATGTDGSKAQSSPPSGPTGTAAPTNTTATNGSQTYGLEFTITVDDKGLAQKVQDYLNGTGPVNPVTPASRFSDTYRKQLESKARDDATKDARTKADQSADNLGFKVGPVKAVSDGNGFGGIPIAAAQATAVDAQATNGSIPSIQVQPGTQTLHYSINVEYYVR